MEDNKDKLKLASQIEREIQEYTSRVITIGEQKDYSQFKLVRRISLFETHTYPTGKFDSQGNYKFWYDIISPRILNEVKNIDFNTNNVTIFSPRHSDVFLDNIMNIKLDEYMRETGQTEEINSGIEEGAGWGNVVWKRTKEGYERCDLKNFYVINQSAPTLESSPVIERHEFTQSDLRAKKKVWNNVQEVIDTMKVSHKAQATDVQYQESTVPYYEIYERNGEVNLQDLKEANGETPAEGDDKEFVLAKVICAGKSTQSGQAEVSIILYAQPLKSWPYLEFHRSPYKGKWFREGIYELLFDHQVRANQIGNQLALGLEYASKVLFRSSDKLIVQNIITDMTNGDIIRSQDLQQIPVRMEGFDQLVADWNRIIQQANELTNSNPFSLGQAPASINVFRTANLLQQASGQLFAYIRSKFAEPFGRIFNDWIIPEMVKAFKAEDVFRLTGDTNSMQELLELLADDWYGRNLIALGPHTPEIAQTLKESKIAELQKKKTVLVKNMQTLWEGYLPQARVVITGENSHQDAKLKSYETFIPLEADPVRREALIEEAMGILGIDAKSLPKSPPQQMNPIPMQAPQLPQPQGRQT